MKIALLLILMIWNQAILAEDASFTWKAEIKFDLESLPFDQALMFVSGSTHVYFAMSNRVETQNPIFCFPENLNYSPKILLDILNDKYAGEHITVEIASNEILKSMRERYLCGDQ